MQIDLNTNTILNGNLKSPGLKKILYNIKILYYLYLRFPLLVEKNDKVDAKGDQEKSIQLKSIKAKPAFDGTEVSQLFAYCAKNYDMEKVVFVFHPGTEQTIISLANQYGFKNIGLTMEKDDSNWALNTNDGHWSCYGHTQAAKQISRKLPACLKKYVL